VEEPALEVNVPFPGTKVVDQTLPNAFDRMAARRVYAHRVIPTKVCLEFKLEPVVLSNDKGAIDARWRAISVYKDLGW
jgi:hypothetical protein